MDNFKGIPSGKHFILTGQSKTSYFFARFIPESCEGEKGLRVMFNLEQKEAITQHGQCIIDEMLKNMREEGVDTSKIRQTKTIFEKFGNTWFPVTYHEDGMVTVDYPSRLFYEQVKENKNGK